MASPIDALLRSNASYASNFHRAPPDFAKLGELAKKATSRICIITCADPRIDPAQFLDLPGNSDIVSIVMRNAGGSARRALVDLLAVDSLVSFTDVFIIRHTDCGTTHFTDASIKRGIRDQLADEHDKLELEAIEFGDCAVPPEQRCSEEVAWLREQAFLREELRGKVVGGVYDLDTGKVELVK
ncbi:uncharacterized protein AB675_11177 [Cyphellophora attinorum]|uniref:Carbonic anhydrase n=1 Tax=Cyphellophora attinorum TaxID=1664694 RepID=A0A0N1HIB3_9EURO|nr:uncharacterized protein AB675_11177 [Phialophora attinorum]KPI35785.1 hypothetical protein AB675_11177 [Phialophora attinorum]